MDREIYLIPRRLDDPPQFFFWDADEAILVIVFTLIGALLGQILVGLVLGLLLARGFARVKAEGGRGIVTRFLYWYTPSRWWLRRTLPLRQHPPVPGAPSGIPTQRRRIARIPSHVREYAG